MIEAAREASLAMLPVWAFGGYVIGRVLAMGHEQFDAWRHRRAGERMRALAKWEAGAQREIESYHAAFPSPSAPDYDRLLRDALKADAELRRGQSERSTQWQSCSVTITNGPGGTKVRQSYDASGHPVPSFTLEDFMHLQPAPLPGPIANTRSAKIASAERDAVLERAEQHKAYLARTLKLKAEKRRAEEEYRARAPHQWRCDKCGYTETLTDDEVAIRADGVGDLWAAHWPAKAQGDAADILCDGRVLRIGGAR